MSVNEQKMSHGPLRVAIARSFRYNVVMPQSTSSLDQKIASKLALQQSLGWPDERKRPLISLPLMTEERLGGTLLMETIPGILSLDCEILVRGKGSKEYGAFFTALADKKPHRIAIIPDMQQTIHAMLEASDMAIFLVVPEKSSFLAQCLRSGTIPIAPPSPMLKNYDPVQESGNAFLFEEPSPWHVFAALVRAIETYKFPFDWRTIQSHCMESTEHS